MNNTTVSSSVNPSQNFVVRARIPKNIQHLKPTPWLMVPASLRYYRPALS